MTSEESNSSNRTANGNRQLGNKQSTAEIDALADELTVEYQNLKFRKWYCKVIYVLGVERVLELRSRCADAKYKGALFSKLANEEMVARENSQKLKDFLDTYGKIW